MLDIPGSVSKNCGIVDSCHIKMNIPIFLEFSGKGTWKWLCSAVAPWGIKGVALWVMTLCKNYQICGIAHICQTHGLRYPHLLGMFKAGKEGEGTGSTLEPWSLVKCG